MRRAMLLVVLAIALVGAAWRVGASGAGGQDADALAAAAARVEALDKRLAELEDEAVRLYAGSDVLVGGRIVTLFCSIRPAGDSSTWAGSLANPGDMDYAFACLGP